MAGYKDRVLADGAVAYWRHDETSGLITYGQVGGHNGDILGNTTLNQPGALADGNKALLFDRGALTQIQLASPATYLQLAAVSVELWVKSSDYLNDGWFNKSNAVGTNHYRLFAESGDPNHALHWDVQVGGLLQRLSYNRLESPLNVWHYLVAVASAAVGQIIYYDGVAVAGPQAIPGAVDVADGPAHIGRLFGLYPSASAFDEVAVYPTVLTAQQVAEHYVLGSGIAAANYQAVAAGRTDWILGPVGHVGDVLERIIVQVVTAGATGIVSIKDGDGAAISIIPASTPAGVYSMPVGALAKNPTTPGWKVTTGAGATALAVGRFS